MAKRIQPTLSLRMYDKVAVDMHSLVFRILLARSYTHIPGPQSPLLRTGLQLLRRIALSVKPSVMLLCWDGPKGWRKALDARYKANRTPQEPWIYEQMVQFRLLLEALDYPQVQSVGFEADDWLAWAAVTAATPTLLVTGDHDLFQLINDERGIAVGLLDGSEERFTVITEREAEEKICEVRLIPTVKMLAGDASDNLPGLKGVGSKTAIKVAELLGPAKLWSFIREPVTVKDKRVAKAIRTLLDNMDDMKLHYRLMHLGEDHSPDDYDLFNKLPPSGEELNEFTQNDVPSFKKSFGYRLEPWPGLEEYYGN